MDWQQIIRETEMRTSRSSGAGGQHVNKVNTRVELRFTPAASSAFGEEEKSWVLDYLQDQLSREGVLIVSSQAERSQILNRQRAWEKMEQILQRAAQPPRAKPKRKRKRPNPALRLAAKRRTSELKEKRRRPRIEDHRRNG